MVRRGKEVTAQKRRKKRKVEKSEEALIQRRRGKSDS